MIIGILFLSSCRKDLADQPYFKPYRQTDFFIDGTSARRPVQNSLAQGDFRNNEAYWQGKTGGQPVQRMPMRPTREMLQRGRERFAIYCTPCHGQTGAGNGMIVQRGFGPPPSYHIGRLRAAPDGHIFDVITNGYGTMYSYASRVETADRWAITGYVRALQLSRHARVDDVPADEREKLGNAPK